ncbi:MAG: tetratricopeptide repeat protein [Thioploca sp.]|nr:tetratricopeptide repeat protein [Thioploca sp.]
MKVFYSNKLRQLLNRLLTITLLIAGGNADALTSRFIPVDSTSAVESLLNEAKTYYEMKQFEQAAALLERALRIDPRNPILWHNLAGVRLAQEDWKRAANLATKSNTLAGSNDNYKELRLRNWVIITQACEGMGDFNCAQEARNRAQALARALQAEKSS